MSGLTPSITPKPVGRAPWRSSKLRLLIVALALAGTLVYLGYMGFQGGATYYWKVGEVEAQGPALVGKPLRVSGQVVPGSVERGPLELKFTLGEAGATLPVVYQGLVPDLFQEDIDVVVEGELLQGNTFHAKNLLVKCPTKWEAKEAG